MYLKKINMTIPGRKKDNIPSSTHPFTTTFSQTLSLIGHQNFFKLIKPHEFNRQLKYIIDVAIAFFI